MKIFAIETSTMLGGVAIADEGGLIAETRMNVKSTHSERLMTAIDHLLRQAGLSLGDMDAFAVASGPGSFTGLRIGLSTAKGLCYAAGKPLVMVPTLDAFAWNFPYCMHPVCIMLDARRGEVYTAIYRWVGEGFRKDMDETSARPGDISEKCGSPVLFAGEGVVKYLETIRSGMGEKLLMAPADKMVPSPSNVAMLGLRKALAGEYTDPAAASPFYIRKSEAEVKWSEKR